jgi:hypothetical protein
MAMTVAAVRTLFTELRAGLVPLIAAIRSRPEADARCLTGDFPESAQQAFGEKVIRAFGYDYTRGRQDKTAHPYMTKLGRGDVRITTRYSDDYLPDGLFSTLHEGRARHVRTGHRRRARGHTAFHRNDGRRARKPVAAMGEPRGPEPAVLAPLVRIVAGELSGRARRRGHRYLLSRDQQGRPLRSSGPRQTR